MNNWNKGVLGDFITLQRGFDLPEYERHTGNVPVVTSSGISDFHNEAKVKAPGVVMGRYGTIGAIYFVEEDYWPHNTTLWIKDFKGNYQRFIYYFLKTLDYQAHNDKSSVPGVNRNHLHLIPVNIPPLPEQRAIAGMLGALDDKIELNRRMNRTLESMARAVFRQWFVEGEEVGDWEIVELGEYVDIRRGASPRPIMEYMGGDIPWLKIADATATGEPYILKTKEFVTKSGAERSVFVEPGDLVLSNSATCGLPFFIDFHGCIHDGWLLFRNERHLSKLYIYQKFLEISEYLVHIADGSVQKNLNTNLVSTQKINLPPMALIQKYDSFAEPIFKKIQSNQHESRTLASLRDSLLPKLMRGEVRVKAQR